MCPRKADPKLVKGLVAAATERILQNGFAATPLDDICAAAGVTKGALFHHFNGKTELALAVLDEWTRAGFDAYSTAGFLEAPTAAQRALGYVDFTIELSRKAPLGCLIGTLAQEVSSSHPELRKRCQAAFRDWATGLAGMLEAARHEAGATARFDSGSVARHFVAVFEGAQILAKSSGNKAVVEEHLLHFRSYLDGLLKGASKGRKKGKRR